MDTTQPSTPVGASHNTPHRSIASLAVGALVALAAVAVGPVTAANAASPQPISGEVTCLNSAVVGIWIEAESSTSGWATWKVPIKLGGHSKGQYSYTLDNGGSYKVTVGCGGTSKKWGLSLPSASLTASNVKLTCNNIHPVLGAAGKRVTRVDLSQGVPYGMCVEK